MGINAIAARAGIDKVLIYRYFGGFDGLLESLAAEREIWPDVAVPEYLSPLQSTDGVAGRSTPDSNHTAEPGLSSARLPLSRLAGGQILWQVLQANVQALRGHPLALEILVWSCAESNVLTRAQAKLRRRQTRKLKEQLAGLSPALPTGDDAPSVYALVWKSYCFALMENHRKEIYKPKDWQLFDQAGQALFAALPVANNKKSGKHSGKKREKGGAKDRTGSGDRKKKKSEKSARQKSKAERPARSKSAG